MIKLQKIEKDYAFIKALASVAAYAFLICVSTLAIYKIKELGFFQ